MFKLKTLSNTNNYYQIYIKHIEIHIFTNTYQGKCARTYRNSKSSRFSRTIIAQLS